MRHWTKVYSTGWSYWAAFLLYQFVSIWVLTMRLLFVILLAVVCIECGRRRKNNGGQTCEYKVATMTMNLTPGILIQDFTNPCKVVQCLDGGKLDVQEIPVITSSEDKPLLFVHNVKKTTNTKFQGQGCKICTCSRVNNMSFLSCEDFGDTCY